MRESQEGRKLIDRDSLCPELINWGSRIGVSYGNAAKHEFLLVDRQVSPNDLGILGNGRLRARMQAKFTSRQHDGLHKSIQLPISSRESMVQTNPTGAPKKL
jgi:hypothetical protein